MGIKQISSKESKKQRAEFGHGELVMEAAGCSMREQVSRQQPGGSSVSWTEATGEVVHCVLGGLI